MEMTTVTRGAGLFDPALDAAELTIEQKVKRLQGPILVIGGSGFVGANLVRLMLAHRDDVYATATRLPAWQIGDNFIAA